MSTVDYFNPNSLDPGTSFKPDGFLGGWTWSQNRRRYEQLAPLQDLMMQLKTQEEINKAREYELNEPVRSSKRASDIATNQATAATVGRQKVAEAEQTELGNEYNRKTMEDRVKAAFLANAQKEGEIGGAKLKRAAELAGMFAEAEKAGPAAVASINQLAKQMGLDNDEIVQAIRANPGVAGVIHRAAINAGIEHQRLLEKERVHGEEQRKTANVTGAWQVKAAETRANRAQKDILEIISKTPLNNRIVTIALAVQQGKLDEALAQSMIQQTLVDVARGKTLPPNILGMPASEIQKWVNKQIAQGGALEPPQQKPALPHQGGDLPPGVERVE